MKRSKELYFRALDNSQVRLLSWYRTHIDYQVSSVYVESLFLSFLYNCDNIDNFIIDLYKKHLADNSDKILVGSMPVIYSPLTVSLTAPTMINGSMSTPLGQIYYMDVLGTVNNSEDTNASDLLDWETLISDLVIHLHIFRIKQEELNDYFKPILYKLYKKRNEKTGETEIR